MAKQLDPILATILQLKSQDHKPAQIKELLAKGESREISNAVRATYDTWIRAGYQVLYPGHKYWPKAFDMAPAAPVLIWAMGNTKLLSIPGVAIVGTRTPSVFGESAIRATVDAIADYRPIIVSGLARGCDTLAHQAALEHQLPQIAILGCGLNYIYPPENNSLSRKILETGGLVITEQLPGEKVSPGALMARNRLQVALSKAVIVGQTAGTGGTIGTVNYALKAGKKVFVPMPPNDKKANFGIWHLANTKACDITTHIPGLRSAKPSGDDPIAYGYARDELKQLPALLDLQMGER